MSAANYRDESRLEHMLRFVLWEAMTIDIPALRPRIKTIVDALPPVKLPGNLDEFA